MDKTTFGDSQAAIDLAKILEKFDNNKYTKKVGRHFERYGKGLSELKFIRDKNIQSFMAILWRDAMLERTENFPDEIKRFVKNVMAGQYRAFLKLCKTK